MNISEFIEALARVAEKVTVPHFLERDVLSFRDKPLSWKIEALIIQLVRTGMPKNYFENYLKNVKRQRDEEAVREKVENMEGTTSLETNET